MTSDRRDTAILAADVRRSVLRAWVSLAGKINEWRISTR